MPPQKKRTKSRPARVSTLQTQFGQVLKDWRKNCDLSQTAVARLTGSDNSQISRFESGLLSPSPKTFHSMLAVYVGHGGCLDAADAVEAARLAGIRLTQLDLDLVAESARKYAPRYAEEFAQTIESAFRSSGRSQAEPERPALPDLSPATSETAMPDIDMAAGLEGPGPSESSPIVSVSIQPQPLLIPDIPGSESLATDEIIATVLEWEAQTQPSAAAQKLWDILKSDANLEKFRSKRRLEFVLSRWATRPDWNRLEWDWLDHNLAELAKRLAADEGLASLSAQATLVAELGQIAWAAIRLTDPAVQPRIKLDAVLNLWPSSATRLIRQWLEHIVIRAPFKLAFSLENELVFESPEEAHFLAAKYLLEKHSPHDIANLCGREERLWPVLLQTARQLHYSGQNGRLLELLQAVTRPNRFAPPRTAAAGLLLAACTPITEARVRAFQDRVEIELIKLWDTSNRDSKLQIAVLFRDMNPERLFQHLQVTFNQNRRQPANLDPITDLQCLAIVGGAKAVQTLIERTHADYEVAIKIAKWLPATEEALFWEALAREDVEYRLQVRAITQLSHAKTVPAYRAIRRISETAAHPKTRRYAETRLDFADDSAYAGLLAYTLDVTRPSHDTIRLLPLVEQAKGFLDRPTPSQDATHRSPSVARALARVWADRDVKPGVRWQAALHLRAHRASAALGICLSTLPMLDTLDSPWAHLLESLLVALATPNSEEVIRSVLPQVTSLAQREVLEKCLQSVGKRI